MAGPRHLLLLTEDEALAAILPAQLAQGTEYRAEPVAPGDGAARLMDPLARIDATLLDAPALEWVEPLRAASGGRPILLLGDGAASELPSLPKPVRLAALVSRMNALLAAFEASPEAGIRMGGHFFHPASRLMLTPEGSRIRLTEKEAAILLYLHRAAGRAVSRAELLGEVWGYSAAVATHTLETHIYRLRRKIEKAPELARLLVTEEGGYRLEPAP
ncbi:response regulator transcription factor [Roseococcus thiosulfatophilus]|uniref:response regulator transcription factor n=1 Tax=Roseococcus thiosulfatophilus TaxID=35813 RepID=UPI001A8EC43D|nr:response regulator transcription factor [Roseococcus thiosulfatophilus]